jgi:hypothetical protein
VKVFLSLRGFRQKFPAIDGVVESLTVDILDGGAAAGVCQTTKTSSALAGLPMQLNFLASYCEYSYRRALSHSDGIVCCTPAMTEPFLPL